LLLAIRFGGVSGSGGGLVGQSRSVGQPVGGAELLSATDKHFAFRKIRTGTKDRLSFKISHFAAQILRVDIQTKVRKFQEFTKIPGRELTDFGIETSS